MISRSLWNGTCPQRGDVRPGSSCETWALNNLKPENKYDFCDLTISQAYSGYTVYVDNVLPEISDTRNKILTYNDKPVKILYHAACSDSVFSAYEIWEKKEFLISNILIFLIFYWEEQIFLEYDFLKKRCWLNFYPVSIMYSRDFITFKMGFKSKILQ